MNQDFQDIKNEYDKYDPETGEDIAQAMYDALSLRLAAYFFNQEDINKRRLIIKLEEGEKEVGTRKKYDWLEALTRHKPQGH